MGVYGSKGKSVFHTGKNSASRAPRRTAASLQAKIIQDPEGILIAEQGKPVIDIYAE